MTMTATTQPGITLGELSRQIDGTRLDAAIEWQRRKCMSPDAIETDHVILASLIRLREIEGKLREPSEDRRKALRVCSLNGGIVIALPAAAFKMAAEHHPDLWNGVDDSPSVKITDQDLFVKEVVRELDREEEDGSTLIHHMFDKAIYAAIENGCEGVDHDD